jgi:hypothetical protein
MLQPILFFRYRRAPVLELGWIGLVLRITPWRFGTNRQHSDRGCHARFDVSRRPL